MDALVVDYLTFSLYSLNTSWKQKMEALLIAETHFDLRVKLGHCIIKDLLLLFLERDGEIRDCGEE